MECRSEAVTQRAFMRKSSRQRDDCSAVAAQWNDVAIMSEFGIAVNNLSAQ